MRTVLGFLELTVTFTDSGAGGSFSPASVTTSSIGTATTQYTTGPNTGTVYVTASSAGVTSVKLKETVQ